MKLKSRSKLNWLPSAKSNLMRRRNEKPAKRRKTLKLELDSRQSSIANRKSLYSLSRINSNYKLFSPNDFKRKPRKRSDAVKKKNKSESKMPLNNQPSLAKNTKMQKLSASVN